MVAAGKPAATLSKLTSTGVQMFDKIITRIEKAVMLTSYITLILVVSLETLRRMLKKRFLLEIQVAYRLRQGLV